MERLLVCLIVFAPLSIFLHSRPAGGQSGIHVDESRKHFLMGVDHFKRHEYRDALDEFIRSYDLRPHWGLLYNIGICYLKLDKKGKALMALLKFIEKGGSEVSAAKTSEVEKFIQGLMDNVGVLRFDGDLGSAKVLVDGEHYPEANESMYLYLDPGKRHVMVLREGISLFEDKVTIKSGKEIIIEIGTVGKILPPAEHAAPSPLAPPAFTASQIEPAVPKMEKSRKLKSAMWFSTAFSAALFTGYAVAGGVALSEAGKGREIEDEWNESTRFEPGADLDAARKEADSHLESARRAKIAANVLFALGAASAAASFGLLFASRREKKEESNAQAGLAGIFMDGFSFKAEF